MLKHLFLLQCCFLLALCVFRPSLRKNNLFQNEDSLSSYSDDTDFKFNTRNTIQLRDQSQEMQKIEDLVSEFSRLSKEALINTEITIIEEVLKVLKTDKLNSNSTELEKRAILNSAMDTWEALLNDFESENTAILRSKAREIFLAMHEIEVDEIIGEGLNDHVLDALREDRDEDGKLTQTLDQIRTAIKLKLDANDEYFRVCRGTMEKFRLDIINPKLKTPYVFPSIVGMLKEKYEYIRREENRF